ncbi:MULTISPECIES: MarR family winged helix-turn-helix transcriptional regulator [Pseudomonadati]|uniref:MarR family transcriptional regulator n=1 Tax=Shewanella aestuarii TaxID=1028752 RepID=A0ABT0KZA2_9GAMM|nr:MarR family transcriptional regulator [Shewanella aestuarii]MCL1116789.1 MarR family transcriptional regulator [Shewanella aestuarii]GGN73283.1 MarR family transcriptional regulator [Shewanella aestuarii]
MKEDHHLHLDNQLCFAVYSTSLAITQLYKPLLSAIELTYTQYLVMLIIWQDEGLNLKDIAHKLAQQPGAITPVVKRLEALDYIQRVRHPEDDRQLSLTLTEKGAALKSKAMKITQQVKAQSGIDEAEMADLKLRLDAFRHKLPKHINLP